jgi:hypothetical protein
MWTLLAIATPLSVTTGLIAVGCDPEFLQRKLATVPRGWMRRAS